MKTVSSYLILQHNRERYHYGDTLFFIGDKSSDMLRVDTIRSQCLVLISSLIEVFADDAVQALIFVIQTMFNVEPTQSLS